MEFKETIKELIKKSKTKRQWIVSKTGYDKETFWKKVSDDTFKQEQKMKIVELFNLKILSKIK